MNRNRKMSGWYSAALLLSVLMTLSVPVTGLAAAAPMTGTEAAFGEEEAVGPALFEDAGETAAEETIAKEVLEDSVLEYREIGARIENYNQTYLNARSSIYSGYMSYDAARELASEADEVMEDALDLKDDDMDAETRALYESYKKTAQQMRKQAQKMTNDELPATGKRTLNSVKKQLTKVVQNLMITYETTEAQTAVADKNVELSQAILESKQRMAGMGMASEQDVLTAMQTLQQAQNGAKQAHDGLQNLRQNILMLLGWNHDAQITFSPIGEPDLNRLAAMDLEQDTKAAIGANAELFSLRQTAAKGAVNRSVKERNVSLTQQNVEAQMQKLYASVISKKQAYDAAVSEYSAASQTMAAADRKYGMGMMGKLEYLGSQVSYLNSKASYTGASLALTKAMEDYDWAVKGLLVSDGG